MKQPIFAIAAMLLLLSSCCREETMSELTDRVFSVAQEQSLLMSARLGEQDTPRTFEDGQCVNAPAEWWCSGFFPGSLWYIYEYTGDAAIAELARKETATSSRPGSSPPPPLSKRHTARNRGRKSP